MRSTVAAVAGEVSRVSGMMRDLDGYVAYL